LDVSLKGGLDKSGEPNTRVDQAPWGHSVDPVKYDTVIVSGLRPLSLVGECTLQSVIASEFITVVLVVGAENLMVFGDLVVDADDLGVIVVLALVQGVDEVVEPLTRDVGSREELKNGQRNRIHTIGLKLVVCKRGANQLAIDGLGRQRIVNREWCRLIGVALTEITCSFGQGRHSCGNREWDSLAEALPGEHEKDLVLNYWAGDRNPELVKLVRRSGGPLLAKPRITGSNFPAVSEPALSIVQRIVCIPRPVPDKVPRPSMKLVAAALERHIDDTAASAPILRVVGGSLDFELPDGVDRRREVVAAPGAIGRAVEKIFIGCRAPAIHPPRRAAEVSERPQSGSPGGPEGRHLPDDARGELVEHEDQAAIQGHRLDLLLVDHLAHASGSRIEQGCVRFDGDRFADRPYFHGYVDCNLLVDLDGDSGLREFA